MSTCILLAPAKINLYLEILGIRPDGFHEVATVLQSIALADRVELRSTGTKFLKVFCDHPYVPNDSTNLAYRAAELMARQFPEALSRYGGFEIRIEKHIPVAAGLAGGSTDAAAVLVGINVLWRLGLTKFELESLASQIGSDVPFCIKGGTVLATGRGEKLSPLADLDHLAVVACKISSLSVSTAWAYKTYRQQFEHEYTSEDGPSQNYQAHSGPMIAAIEHRDSKKIGQLLHNDLEKVVLPTYPIVETLRQIFSKQPEVLGTAMSGSGPTVIALCASVEIGNAIAAKVQAKINNPDLEMWVSQLSSTGIKTVSQTQ